MIISFIHVFASSVELPITDTYLHTFCCVVAYNIVSVSLRCPAKILLSSSPKTPLSFCWCSLRTWIKTSWTYPTTFVTSAHCCLLKKNPLHLESSSSRMRRFCYDIVATWLDNPRTLEKMRRTWLYCMWFKKAVLIHVGRTTCRVLLKGNYLVLSVSEAGTTWSSLLRRFHLQCEIQYIHILYWDIQRYVLTGLFGSFPLIVEELQCSIINRIGSLGRS